MECRRSKRQFESCHHCHGSSIIFEFGGPSLERSSSKYRYTFAVIISTVITSTQFGKSRIVSIKRTRIHANYNCLWGSGVSNQLDRLNTVQYRHFRLSYTRMELRLISVHLCRDGAVPLPHSLYALANTIAAPNQISTST